MREALYWKKAKDNMVQCVLCPHNCVLKPDQWGICRARQNKKGKLYSMVYGKVVSFGIDPIEKKPFFHFAPGSNCMSIATTGCNLRCDFCQNWSISMAKEPWGQKTSPEEIVDEAKKTDVAGIAYTYTEPTIFYEFALDTMKLAKKAGLYNVWVSNGYTNPEPIKQMARYLDAVNVDLKGPPTFYKKLCKVPDDTAVKKALKEYKKHGVWIEVTNMLIPGYNDKPRQILELAEWTRKNLGKETPLHFSRFLPQHKLADAKPTPTETLERAHKIAKETGLEYVYIGNVQGHEAESTYCPVCGELAIKRVGFSLWEYSDKCPKCGAPIAIKGKKWSGVIKV